jgi:hypothetical protein
MNSATIATETTVNPSTPEPQTAAATKQTAKEIIAANVKALIEQFEAGTQRRAHRLSEPR